LWFNSPDLDAFSLFYQPRDTARVERRRYAIVFGRDPEWPLHRVRRSAPQAMIFDNFVIAGGPTLGLKLAHS
jgi:hypothetical protein